MTYPDPHYHGEQGEISATFRPVTAPAELDLGRGSRGLLPRQTPTHATAIGWLSRKESGPNRATTRSAAASAANRPVSISMSYRLPS